MIFFDGLDLRSPSLRDVTMNECDWQLGRYLGDFDELSDVRVCLRFANKCAI